MDALLARVGHQQPGQVQHLLLGLRGGVGIGVVVDHVHDDPPLGDHPGGHRGVDAPGQQGQGPAPHAHGEAPRPRLRVGVDVCVEIPHLHMDRQLRVAHVRRQMRVAVVELSPNVLGQLDGGHGEGFVRPLGLHLKRFGGLELVPQVLHRALDDLVLVLGAGLGPAHSHRPEHLAHGLPGALKVGVFVQGLHVGGGLAGIHLKRTVFFQPPLGVAHQFLLKAPAVQALEHHFSLLEQDDLCHNIPCFPL